MNFETLIRKTAQKTSHSEDDVQRIVDSLIETFRDSLLADEPVVIETVGNFSVCTRAARSKRDPKSKELVEIPACKTVKFTLSNNLKTALNQGL